jgi:hypothetical protein
VARNCGTGWLEFTRSGGARVEDFDVLLWIQAPWMLDVPEAGADWMFSMEERIYRNRQTSVSAVSESDLIVVRTRDDAKGQKQKCH